MVLNAFERIAIAGFRPLDFSQMTVTNRHMLRILLLVLGSTDATLVGHDFVDLRS